MPNTPIAFPFTQNTLPLTNSQSWSNLIIWPYKRLAGFGTVKNNDPIVFNFPAGDTVVLEETSTSYYEIVRRTARELKMYGTYTGPESGADAFYYNQARKQIWENNHVVFRPVDRRDNYVKRCIGIPGDVITIIEGTVYVNDKKLEENSTQQTTYIVNTNGTKINPKAFERLNISVSDQLMRSSSVYQLPLSKENAEKIKEFTNVTNVTQYHARPGDFEDYIFPYSENYRWNEDNYGPIRMPKKGETIKIDTTNICLYERIIDVYEGKRLLYERWCNIY